MDKPNAAAVATIPASFPHPTPIATPQPTKTKIIVAKNSATNFLNIISSPFVEIIAPNKNKILDIFNNLTISKKCKEKRDIAISIFD